MLTKYFLPFAFAAGTLMLSGAGAQAVPLAKPSAAPLPIETVGWCCGPGLAREPAGQMRAERSPVHPAGAPLAPRLLVSPPLAPRLLELVIAFWDRRPRWKRRGRFSFRW
ncbi:hypothetical protein [Mesorhizobium sp.]|uniref:hypothetical protein n=1 Tax=Mesorhizobium sp. TaxID=1871066 RepID=UPI0025EA6F1B|nr:hypothetical protein [Mesorhizobium sp.]